MNSKEFIKALKAICEEKQISEDVIFEGMEGALKKAYTKETGLPNIRIEIDKDILRASEKEEETRVLMGQKVARGIR